MTAALSRVCGFDLEAFRPEHVDQRMRRAIEREGVADDSGLLRLLGRDPGARSRFRRSVAVSYTGLFRDPHQFELLESQLLPPLLADGRRLTVWSAGCSDGSELYSVATLLDRAGALERSVLLGSDLLDENLESARRGRYGDVVFPASLRARMRWERRDLVHDGAPAGGWRLILCRNVAIYLTPAAKRAVQATLVAALARDGVLLLGRSERLSKPRELGLEPAGPHAYRRAA